MVFFDPRHGTDTGPYAMSILEPRTRALRDGGPGRGPSAGS